MKVVDAEQPVRDAFSEMADDDPELRKAIEDAADDQPQHVQARLDAETVDRAVEAAREERLDHRLRRRLRMDVDGDVERFGGLEDRPESLVVEILALRVRVDDRALHSEAGYRALELAR